MYLCLQCPQERDLKIEGTLALDEAGNRIRYARDRDHGFGVGLGDGGLNLAVFRESIDMLLNGPGLVRHELVTGLGADAVIRRTDHLGNIQAHPQGIRRARRVLRLARAWLMDIVR